MNSKIMVIFFICGDFNSRCGKENDYIVGVDDICHRDVVDFKCNSYCNTFIDFLISVNCCILLHVYQQKVVQS
jgi:hypothetical protein